MSLARVKITVELADETVHDLVIGNVSLVAWDRTRTKFKWPEMSEAPALWMTFIAWHHMKATGLIPDGTKYETFENELCVAIADTDAEEHELAEAAGRKPEVDLVDPTEPSREPAYA